MSEAVAARPEAQGAGFSPRIVLALVLVGVISFSALAVLSAYAPDLRADSEGGANALSPSAVGYEGAVILARGVGMPVVVSRAPLHRAAAENSLLVLTPPLTVNDKDLADFPDTIATLIVLPKWLTVPDQRRRGFVRKAGLVEPGERLDALLKAYAPETRLASRKAAAAPALRGTGVLFAEGTYLPLAEIDRFRTISGKGWVPVLVDETGAAVLVRSAKQEHVYVLADPDLLNTQGLAKRDNARAGMAVLDVLRAGRGVIFDVTLNGYKRGRGLWRTALEPPWLAATLCAVAAALLMGLHALARFGPARAQGRAFALGRRALVDNSAGLVRMAGKEHQLAPAYVDLTKSLVSRAAGAGDPERWLDDLARARGAEAPEALAAEAAQVKGRADVLALARKLYRWRVEMTRERR